MMVLSSLRWKEAKLYFLLSCVPTVASGKAERFGAKKEAKKHISYFLWRRERSKETSTPSKASPVYGEDATENRGNRRFIRVLVWLSSFRPEG
jgi:hypothetical protein